MRNAIISFLSLTLVFNSLAMPANAQTADPSPIPSETVFSSPVPSGTFSPTPTPSETANPPAIPSETATPSAIPSETATPAPSPAQSETTPENPPAGEEPLPTQGPDAAVDIAQPSSSAEPVIRTVTLSFAGDCTIGDDDKYAWNTFDSVYKKVSNPSYFFQGVQNIFLNDDFTFVNFEGTFTKSMKKAEKEYRFKGDPSYVGVLKDGGIDGVTLANNHSMDYLARGFADTTAALDEAGILWSYFEKSFIFEAKGLKIGFLGYKGWENETRSDKLLKEQAAAMRGQGVQYIIACYHWGDQNSYVPNALQKRMAHFAIDNGADLVIGHHPHVLQGREEYKGKPILYSLGNFCFGGAPNPSDKDSVIYQVIIGFDANCLKITNLEEKIIPVRISSEARRNDYRPIIAADGEGERILKKFADISGRIR